MEHSRRKQSSIVCKRSIPRMIGYKLFVATVLCIHLKCFIGIWSVYASDLIGDTLETEVESQEGSISWSHSVFLDGENTKNIRLYWNLRENDIVFKVEARTKGYVGIGFSRHGKMSGADMVIGWVRDQQAFLQDRHGLSKAEPKKDKKQDWYLISGYENATHTTLTFRRKYETCDKDDVKLTKDTMRIIYAFHEEDPVEEKLKYHESSRRGSKSILLTQYSNYHNLSPRNEFLHWDLRSQKVPLSRDEETLYWCRIFRLPNVTTRHHVTGYMPIIQDGNYNYVHHILVYECYSGGLSDDAKFESEVQSDGHQCHRLDLPPILRSCDNLLLVWTVGSQGFFLPENIGHPLDPLQGPRYFKMEIHYDNPYLKRGIRDSSGIRIFYTQKLRPIEAGILSVGIEPYWKHIIPPKQHAVISYGHCISECTRKALPPDGITVFAAVLNSHLMSRKIQLRHIRNGKELAPIVMDNAFDFNYQECRVLTAPVHILPGDHLIAECTYNTRSEEGVTLGGFSTREEMCFVYIYHYPKIDMSVCHSLPTMSTLLSSVGVKELWEDRMPQRIRRPYSLRNLTLSEHLRSYDWSKHFKHFHNATKHGSFQAICGNRHSLLLSGTAAINVFPNITKTYVEPSHCSHRQRTSEKPVTKHPKPETTVFIVTKSSSTNLNTKNSSSKLKFFGFFNVLLTIFVICN